MAQILIPSGGDTDNVEYHIEDEEETFSEDWTRTNSRPKTYVWIDQGRRVDHPAIIIIIIHLLGLAPAGYLAAPDSGHKAGCGVVHTKYP
jgi:hypothetical protein